MNQPPGRSSVQQNLAFVAVCFGFFMVVVDAGILNVAVPAIGKELGNSLNSLEWVINSYTLVLASLLLSAGALGDLIGAKRVYLTGLAVFTLASLACSLSATIPLLVVARLIQGLGGALLIPTSLALIAAAYPDPAARSRAVGIWATISAAGFTSSITFGGLLIDSWGWRSIFWLNVPTGIVALALTWWFVVPVPGTRRQSFDWPGQGLGILALFCLTFALIEGHAQGWTSVGILTSLVLFVVASSTFIWVERRVKAPMVPLKLFINPTFSTAVSVGLVFNFCLYGQLFVFSLLLQNVEGRSATVTGLAFLPFTVVNVLMPSLSGWLTARMGPRLPMAAGLGLAGVGSLVLDSVHLGVHHPLGGIVGLVIFGFGSGLILPAMTTTALAGAPTTQAGIASAILNAMRQTGGVLGVAVMGVFVGGSSFIQGLHGALMLVVVVFWLGCAATLVYVPGGKLRHAKLE